MLQSSSFSNIYIYICVDCSPIVLQIQEQKAKKVLNHINDTY